MKPIVLTPMREIVLSTCAHGVATVAAWMLFEYIAMLRGEEGALYGVGFTVGMGASWLWSIVSILRARWHRQQRLGKVSS
jgi:hypothetical protein